MPLHLFSSVHTPVLATAAGIGLTRSAFALPCSTPRRAEQSQARMQVASRDGQYSHGSNKRQLMTIAAHLQPSTLQTRALTRASRRQPCGVTCHNRVHTSCRVALTALVRQLGSSRSLYRRLSSRSLSGKTYQRHQRRLGRGAPLARILSLLLLTLLLHTLTHSSRTWIRTHTS